MRKILFTTLITMLFSLVACTQAPEKQLIGAWKTADDDPMKSFVTRTLVFTEKTMDDNGSGPKPITMMSKDNKVFIEFEKLMLSVNFIDKDTMVLSIPLLGSMKYVRTTEADIQTIREEKQKRGKIKKATLRDFIDSAKGKK